MGFGISSEVGRIRSMLIKHPKDAFVSQTAIDAQWERLNYFGPPDYNKALAEYERFVGLLSEEIPDIHYLPHYDRCGMDSIYVRDAVIMTPKGAILCKMGKQERQGEEIAAGQYLAGRGIPILGRIEGEGRVEGGDIIWLDEKTPAVGQGYRTNAAGIARLKELLSGIVDEVMVVPLPHWQGPTDVFHLMSIISPIDYDLAVVYSRLMPVPFRERLLSRGMTLVEVPDEEFESMGCNILALGPRVCLMLEGNPETRRRLEEHGADARVYAGWEISRKGAGGPTCLTRPLEREG